MTLTTTTRTVTYTGNGVTTEFSFSFKIPLATDLVVQTFDTVSLALATISSSIYSVTGIGNNSGGTVTYPLSGSPIASTVRIILTRTVPLTQLLDIQNQSGFFPNVVEDQLDLTIMQIQQNAGDIGLAIAAPVGDNITDFTLPLDAARAEKYLFFASDGAVGVTGTAPAVQYQGAFTTGNEPTLRLGGTALVTGDLYFNTTSNVFKVYNGSSWITAVAAAAASVTVTDSGAFFAGGDVEAVLADIGANYAKKAGPAFTGAVSMAGAFTLSGTISPSQITSNQNNYDPTGLSGALQLRINTDASRNVTGLAGGANGRLILITNIGSFNVALPTQSSSSTAANRFLFAGGDLTLIPDESVMLRYDGTSSRWRAAQDVVKTGLITRYSAVTTTTGTAHNIGSIPAATNRITMMLNGVSLSGTDNLLVQIGDAGGIENDNYVSKGSDTGAEQPSEIVTATAGYIIGAGIAADAGNALSGRITLVRIDGNIWVADHMMHGTAAAQWSGGVLLGAGIKTLTAELTQITLTRTGSNTFDAGSINIMTEV